MKESYTAADMASAAAQGFRDGVKAAYTEVKSRYVGDNNREDMEARRCAEAIEKLMERHD